MARTLKIEARGDFFRGHVHPALRLKGRWLERLGFKPGGRVQVISTAPGVMELRLLQIPVDATPNPATIPG